MRLNIVLMTTWLLASCAATGDFCDLAIRMEVDKESSARYLLEHERALLVDMNVNNKLLDRCGAAINRFK